MSKELVLLIDDIQWELGAEEWINNIKEMYGDLNAAEVIRLIVEMMEYDTEHKATEATVGIYEDFNLNQIRDTEVIVFNGNKFEYMDFLLAVLATLMLIDKLKRPVFIVNAAMCLLEIHRELAERFKEDVANHVYYEYIK